MITDIKFKYDGYWRRVSNVTFEPATKSLIGFEMRKNGQFSYRIKRYSYDKISDFAYVRAEERNGPVVGMPV